MAFDETAASERLVDGKPRDEEPLAAQSWLGYTWRVVGSVALGTWSVLHYVGEKLAYGLGITAPDWQYAIDLHATLEQEREEARSEEEQTRAADHCRRLERLRQLESAQV